MLAPTLVDVWATRFLADGVEIQPIDQRFDFVVLGGSREADSQPLGSPLAAGGFRDGSTRVGGGRPDLDEGFGHA